MKQGIINKVKAVIDSNFEVEDISYVPDIDNSKLTFGNKGLRFEATTLFIDMRGSAKILSKHNRTSVAKIYMCYFHTIVTIARSLGGEVRSFNGDGMLVFFQGTTKATLSKAVQAAMQMKYMLAINDGGVKTKMETYSSVDFGIGIDDGKILCTKVGIAGTNNRDLVWVGNAVNKAVKIGDLHSDPYHVGISSYVYSNLTDEVKFHTTKDAWGNEQKINMWSSATIQYNGNSQTYYRTSYHWTVS